MFEQDRVLVRLRQRIARDQQIQVCFLTGSYGRGTQDKFSDLDLVLAYKDEGSLTLAYENRRDFVRSVLPFVPARSFDADHIRPYLHSALYANGTKVDYQYAAMDSMLMHPVLYLVLNLLMPIRLLGIKPIDFMIIDAKPIVLLTSKTMRFVHYPLNSLIQRIIAIKVSP